MIDRVKLVERIAARGRRKLEKRNAKIVKRREAEAAAVAAARAAEDAILAARSAPRRGSEEGELRMADGRIATHQISMWASSLVADPRIPCSATMTAKGFAPM